MKATVNLMTEQAEVEYLPNGHLDANKIREAIEELGFEASIIERYMSCLTHKFKKRGFVYQFSHTKHQTQKC